MAHNVGYLLDTNILVHLLRANELGERIDAKYSLRSELNRSMVSVVTVGEMLSLTKQFNWGQKKTDSLKEILRELVWIDINRHEIMNAYAEIDHFSRRGVTPANPMGQNDLWIAATASVTAATLLTTDKDFDHLNGKFLSRIWINPDKEQAA